MCIEKELKCTKWQGNQGKLCVKACIIEQQHFKGGETLFKRTQKEFFECQLLYFAFSWKRKGKRWLRKQRRNRYYEKGREMLYSLSVCQAHWCVTCPSQWGPPASPSLSGFFSTHHAIHFLSILHPLLLLNFSILRCLIVVQPCHLFFFPSHT